MNKTKEWMSAKAEFLELDNTNVDFLLFLFFETGFHYVAPPILKLTL